MKTKHYREVRCENRLPDKDGEYLTSRGWMEYSACFEEFSIAAELLKWGTPGTDRCVQPKWWLEKYDPEAEDDIEIMGMSENDIIDAFQRNSSVTVFDTNLMNESDFRSALKELTPLTLPTIDKINNLLTEWRVTSEAIDESDIHPSVMRMNLAKAISQLLKPEN